MKNSQRADRVGRFLLNGYVREELREPIAVAKIRLKQKDTGLLMQAAIVEYLARRGLPVPQDLIAAAAA